MVVDTPRPSAGERSASRGPRDLWTADAVVDKARPDAEEVAMILVVGATGQLGSLVVRTLRGDGHPVRARVRAPAAAEDLAATGAGLVRADLTEPETLDAALDGVTAVVATANVAAPTRPADRSEALDAG